MELMQLIESIRAEEASMQRLFGSDNGERSVRSLRKNDPQYLSRLAEAARFFKDVCDGKRPTRQLREALSTSDFPYLFGDTLDRMLLGNYQAYPATYRRFLKVSRVRDFRTVDRYRVSDGDQRLGTVAQGENYPGSDRDESTYSFKVNKYGRRFDILWEALVNDDLDALKDTPRRMALAALRTEMYFASSLYVANSTLFTTGHGNKGTAAISKAAIMAGWNAMVGFTDENGEPIFNQPTFLVVPPVLEMEAITIIGSLYLQYTGGDATSGAVATAQPTNNPLSGRLQVVPDPYIPIVDTSHGSTSWYLFADPDNGHAAEVAFLAGYEEPQLYMKTANQTRLGGGPADPMEGDFDTDAVGYKVRHVMGGSHANAVGGWRFAYWSDGTA